MRLLVVIGGLWLAACAGAQVSQAKLGEVNRDVRAAEALGAAQVPAAAPYLQMAREGVDGAAVLIGEGHLATAALVLERAEADAELAAVRARQAAATADAAAAQQRLDELRARGKP